MLVVGEQEMAGSGATVAHIGSNFGASAAPNTGSFAVCAFDRANSTLEIKALGANQVGNLT